MWASIASKTNHVAVTEHFTPCQGAQHAPKPQRVGQNVFFSFTVAIINTTENTILLTRDNDSMNEEQKNIKSPDVKYHERVSKEHVQPENWGKDWNLWNQNCLYFLEGDFLEDGRSMIEQIEARCLNEVGVAVNVQALLSVQDYLVSLRESHVRILVSAFVKQEVLPNNLILNNSVWLNLDSFSDHLLENPYTERLMNYLRSPFCNSPRDQSIFHSSKNFKHVSIRLLAVQNENVLVTTESLLLESYLDITGGETLSFVASRLAASFGFVIEPTGVVYVEAGNNMIPCFTIFAKLNTSISSSDNSEESSYLNHTPNIESVGMLSNLEIISKVNDMKGLSFIINSATNSTSNVNLTDMLANFIE